MDAPSSLAGVIVTERSDSLAVSVCGTLLAQLGATVIRVDRGKIYPGLTEAAGRRAEILGSLGKTKVNLTPGCAKDRARWRSLVARSDVVLFHPHGTWDRHFIDREGKRRIVCSITPVGGYAQTNGHAGAALQAIGGVMACTGEAAGPPEVVQFPVVEMLTGVNAAVSVLASLRQKEKYKILQSVDITCFDAEIALFTAFVSNIFAGKREGYRLGCGHHLCAPWNAYQSLDGWVEICLASDKQWLTLVSLIGKPEIANNERFSSNALRVKHVSEVDQIIWQWTHTKASSEIIDRLVASGLPVGQIRTVPELLAVSKFTVEGDIQENTAEEKMPGSFLQMSHSPGRNFPAKSTDDIDGLIESLGPKRSHHRDLCRDSLRPLQGIRVIEIGPYTAGPLAGRYLADLGAEVLKIEPPEGEVTRKWLPKFGGYSGYFANCNAGKGCLSLDLKNKDDQEQLLRLVNEADIFLENLRPGALTKLGFGSGQLRQQAPKLIYCSISGFGHMGEPRPALDSVIQAEAGVMRLVGAMVEPRRIGVSIADEAVAHAAPLAILAALRFRDLTGEGQHIDLSMRDVLAWLTQLSWPSGQSSILPWSLLRQKDGWIIADCSEEIVQAILRDKLSDLGVSEALDVLRRIKIAAVPVLELGQVFNLDIVSRRSLIQYAEICGEKVPILSSPYRLGGLPLTIGSLPECLIHVAKSDWQELYRSATQTKT